MTFLIVIAKIVVEETSAKVRSAIVSIYLRCNRTKQNRGRRSIVSIERLVDF